MCDSYWQCRRRCHHRRHRHHHHRRQHRQHRQLTTLSMPASRGIEPYRSSNYDRDHWLNDLSETDAFYLWIDGLSETPLYIVSKYDFMVIAVMRSYVQYMMLCSDMLSVLVAPNWNTGGIPAEYGTMASWVLEIREDIAAYEQEAAYVKGLIADCDNGRCIIDKPRAREIFFRFDGGRWFLRQDRYFGSYVDSHSGGCFNGRYYGRLRPGSMRLPVLAGIDRGE